MVGFGRLTEVTEGCRVEFEHLYVWPDGYEAVDARFINMRGRPDAVRQNVLDAARRLFFLNPDANLEKVLNHLLKARRRAFKKGSCSLSEDEVKDVVEMVFVEMLWRKGTVATRRYVEWKVGNVFGFTKAQVAAIAAITEDYMEVANAYAKRRRQSYAMRCLGQVRQMKATNIVSEALMEMGEVSIADVCKETGLSYQRVRRAYSAMGIMKARASDRVYAAAMRLVSQGKRVTVKSVCRLSGVSPKTARKYLGGLITV